MSFRTSRNARTSWFRSVSLLLLVPLLAMVGLNLASSARAQDAPTITMWFDTTGGPETAECMIANAIDPFNAQGGPQVEATLQADNWTATRTALAGGAGPDVVTTPGPSFGYELGEAGQLVPLDEYATQYGWSDTFIPWALDLGRVNGQLYSIPNEIETLVLYYNETLFEEHGWTVPTTLPELMTLAETIAAEGIIPFAHTNAEWRPTNEWFVGEFMNHHAGPEKVYQALTGEAQWTDPAFVEALTMLNQMQQNGWFMGGLDRYYTTPTADANALFSEGEAAMKIEGTWFVNDALTFFPEVEQEWNWAPCPPPPATRSSTWASAPPTRSMPTRSTRRRPRSSSPTSSRPRPRRRSPLECSIGSGAGHHPAGEVWPASTSATPASWRP